MKKALVLLVAVCFMVLGASSAKADTRGDSLGLSAGQQIDGLDSIWMFPQDASKFGNVFDNRLGGSLPAGPLAAGDWFGVIHKDFDDIGYLGIYTLRPFANSDGVVHSTNAFNNFGVFDGTWGGNLNTPLNPTSGNGALNTTLNIGGVGAATYNQVVVPGLVANNPENKVDLFWAKEINDISLGVHINYGDNNTGNSQDALTKTSAGNPAIGAAISSTATADTQVLGIDLGLGLKSIGFLDSLDLGLGYSMATVNNTQVINIENPAQSGTNVGTNNSGKDNGISSIRVNGLGKIKVNDNATGRIFVNLKLDNDSVTGTSLRDLNNNGDFTGAGETTTATNSYSNTNVNVGLACNHKALDGKAMVIVGLGLIYDSRNWKQSGFTNAAGSGSANIIPGADYGDTLDETDIAVPLNVAVESPLFDWMKARIGVTKNLYQSQTDKIVQPFALNNANAGNAYQDNHTAQTTVNAPGAIATFVGVGCTFSNWTLDFQLNPTTLIPAITTAAPTQGIVYGSNVNAGRDNGSIINQLSATIAQFDFRYAF